MAIGTVLLGKPTNARSIILHVCADESPLEEPRATCMRAEMVGYIMRRADTKEYLHPAPVTEQGRCVKPCAARRLPLIAILIMSVTLMNNTVWPISR